MRIVSRASTLFPRTAPADASRPRKALSDVSPSWLHRLFPHCSVPAASTRRALRSALLLSPLVAPLAAQAGVGDIIEASQRASMVTYSQNGKNFARMAEGDSSMGSKYTSTEPRALKRKAAMACKSPKVIEKLSTDEKQCTMNVLNGELEPVLAALDALGDACQVDATHVCL